MRDWTARASSLAKRSVQYLLRHAGVEVVRNDVIQRLRFLETAANDLELIRSIDDPDTAATTLAYLEKSHSQLRQDLFVLSRLKFKRGGYFVEFGATNGIALSNTYLLEKDFGWDGILAEPAKGWHNALRANRSSVVEPSCVWSFSGSSVAFHEARSAEYSTISEYVFADSHGQVRERGTDYMVPTISLSDLLQKHRAPELIDYLSIDTEGSEFEILSSFDFSSYKFRVITCEHNYTPMRGRIHSLLTSNGYSRVLENISQFDDWYVLGSEEAEVARPSLDHIER